jgi:Spy/CpxP family protein refolding chaperone
MFGILVGTACLFGLIGLAKSQRHGHHSHHGRCGGRGSRRGPHRTGRRGRGFDRAMGEAIKRGLHVDRDQEDLVDHAMGDVREALRELKDVMKESRQDAAAAFEGDQVDDAALDAIFETQDAALTQTRRQVVSALKQVHAVLDDEQRATAVQWLANGPTWRR